MIPFFVRGVIVFSKSTTTQDATVHKIEMFLFSSKQGALRIASNEWPVLVVLPILPPTHWRLHLPGMMEPWQYFIGFRDVTGLFEHSAECDASAHSPVN